MSDDIEIEEADATTKPSVIKPTGDDIHTRNIRAIAEVVRTLRDDLTNHRALVSNLAQTVNNQQTEIASLKTQLILAQHMGNGATVL